MNKKLFALTALNVALLANLWLVVRALAAFAAGVAWPCGALLLVAPLLGLVGVVAAFRERSIALVVVNALCIAPYVVFFGAMTYTPGADAPSEVHVAIARDAG
jgi:hypothetical protein